MGSGESLTDVLKELAATQKIERPLAVVDVETTGTWINYDRIVQVALVSITPDLDVTSLDQLINPEMLIPDEVIEIHRITNEAVAQAPTFGEFAPALREALSGHDFVGYNFRFDRDMLEAEFTRVQVPFSFSGSLIRTGSPGVMFLTTSKGPVITWSPSLSPLNASKYLSPAMPVTTGMKTARPARMTNTPSRSSRISSACIKDSRPD